MDLDVLGDEGHVSPGRHRKKLVLHTDGLHLQSARFLSCRICRCSCSCKVSSTCKSLGGLSIRRGEAGCSW